MPLQTKQREMRMNVYGNSYANYIVHISNTIQDKTPRNKVISTVWSLLSQLNKRKMSENQNLEFKIHKSTSYLGMGISDRTDSRSTSAQYFVFGTDNIVFTIWDNPSENTFVIW